MTDTNPVPSSSAGKIGIAQMRSVYRSADVHQRLSRLPAPSGYDHEPLRHTYERMLERVRIGSTSSLRACRRWSTSTTSCPTFTPCSTT